MGAYYCRDGRDRDNKYISVLDANKRCPRCSKHWADPKYIGKSSMISGAVVLTRWYWLAVRQKMPCR